MRCQWNDVSDPLIGCIIRGRRGRRRSRGWSLLSTLDPKLHFLFHFFLPHITSDSFHQFFVRKAVSRDGNVPLARRPIDLHPPPVSRSSSAPSARPEALVAQAVLAITGVALAVCLCMTALGATARLDQWIANMVSQARPADGFRDVSLPGLWASAALGAMLVSSVLLNTPGWWRRWVFWLASLSVTLAWAPVLAFSSLKPALAIPCLAVLAAGAVSFFYISRHHMPTDLSSSPDETR
jgi:hypothetical protein